MGQAELLILGLLVAVGGLSALARVLRVPYPILLVLAGAVVGFLPGLPEIRLDPEVVLVIFLPPLLYGSAIFANYNDLKENLRGLTLSTVGLVLATMCGVAWAAHALIDGMSWEAAFVLGAIVSPTDPLAAATVMRQLNAPRRLVSGIEGEGLFNDATALVAYKVAVTAVVAGSFSLVNAGLDFIVGAAGGVAVGLLAGAVLAAVRRRVADTDVNVTLSLLTGYAAYIPADALGVSGILATVTAGIYVGILAPAILPTRARLQGYFVWEILDFVVNTILFVLVGLQLRTIVEGLDGYSTSTLVGYGLAISGVVVGVRLLWFFTMPYLIRMLDRRPSQLARRLSPGARVVLVWSGMRGAVSLAIALALPLATDTGDPFPNRDLIIFLTFAVIFFTLVVQGLTLPLLLRRLAITDGGEADEEEVRARMAASKAALEQIDELAAEEWTREETLERMRGLYEYRKRRFAARAGKIADDGYEDRSLAYQQAVQAVLEAQRGELLRLRSSGELSNETMIRILREIDLEEARLEI